MPHSEKPGGAPRDVWRGRGIDDPGPHGAEKIPGCLDLGGGNAYVNDPASGLPESAREV